MGEKEMLVHKSQNTDATIKCSLFFGWCGSVDWKAISSSTLLLLPFCGRLMLQILYYTVQEPH